MPRAPVTPIIATGFLRHDGQSRSPEHPEMRTVTTLQDRLLTGEEVAFSTSKHWFALVADSKWAILMVVGALVAAWLQPDSTSGIGGFFNRSLDLVRQGLWLGAIAWIAYNVVAWRTAEYHVTNRRVLGQEGLIRRRSTDTLLTSIADLKTRIPALGRMLGYGDIRILTASGEAGADSFTAVSKVEAFKREVLERKTRGDSAPAPAPPAPQAPAAAPAAMPAPAAPADITTTLGELARLRDAGAITAEDYEAKKTELLARI
jgi:hypothetical protein